MGYKLFLLNILPAHSSSGKTQYLYKWLGKHINFYLGFIYSSLFYSEVIVLSCSIFWFVRLSRVIRIILDIVITNTRPLVFVKRYAECSSTWECDGVSFEQRAQIFVHFMVFLTQISSSLAVLRVCECVCTSFLLRLPDSGLFSRLFVKRKLVFSFFFGIYRKDSERSCNSLQKGTRGRLWSVFNIMTKYSFVQTLITYVWGFN